MNGGVVNPKPRLLLIVPWLATGGADKFNLDLVGQLSQAGWNITIATTQSGDHSWSSLFARYTRDIISLSQLLPVTEYPGFLRDLIQSRAIDVVLISHSEIAYHLLPYLRAHAPGVSFLDYCHLPEPGWNRGGYARLAITHQALLDLNVVSSHHLKSWMVAQGGAAERIEVAYTGVDANDWRPDGMVRARLRRELDLAESTPVILFAGRVCAQKQPRVLARTAARLRDHNIECTTLVAGDGPDIEWLRGFIEEHALHQEVRLLGAEPNARVRELMAAADLFFLPSQYEGVALSIYEAMACSLPCVTADVGGQAELLTADSGVLIKPRSEDHDVEAYASALTTLLADLPRCRRMGTAGRTRVTENFGVDQMGARMDGLLARALQLHSQQPRPQPTLEHAARMATRAVKNARLFERADVLWSVRSRNAHRVRAYQFMARRLERWYRRGVERGWHWLPPLRARIRLAVLRRS